MKTSLRIFCGGNNTSLLSREQLRQVKGGTHCTTLYGGTNTPTQTISGYCSDSPRQCEGYAEKSYGSMCDFDPGCAWVKTTCS